MVKRYDFCMIVVVMVLHLIDDDFLGLNELLVRNNEIVCLADCLYSHDMINNSRDLPCVSWPFSQSL
jgi:hypothetical protein